MAGGREEFNRSVTPQTSRTGAGAELLTLTCVYTHRKLSKANQPEVMVAIRTYRDVFQAFLAACPVL